MNKLLEIENLEDLTSSIDIATFHLRQYAALLQNVKGKRTIEVDALVDLTCKLENYHEEMVEWIGNLYKNMEIVKKLCEIKT